MCMGVLCLYEGVDKFICGLVSENHQIGLGGVAGLNVTFLAIPAQFLFFLLIFLMPKKQRKFSVVSGGLLSEDDLQIAIIQNLNLRSYPRVFWFHVPNGKKRNIIDATKLKKMGIVAGVPDLIFFKNGQIFCLELKVKKGRSSQAQIFVRMLIEAAGGICAVTMGLDESLKQLVDWDILKCK